MFLLDQLWQVDDLCGCLTYERGVFVSESECTRSEKRWEEMDQDEQAGIVSSLRTVLAAHCSALADSSVALRTEGILAFLASADDDDLELFTAEHEEFDGESMTEYLRSHELTLDFLRAHLAVEVAQCRGCDSNDGVIGVGSDAVSRRRLAELGATLAAGECAICMTPLYAAITTDARRADAVTDVAASGQPLCLIKPLADCLGVVVRGDNAPPRAAASTAAVSGVPQSLRAKAGLPPPSPMCRPSPPSTAVASVDQLCCGHHFHTECITRWRRTAGGGGGMRKGCPLCRRPVVVVACFE